MTFISSFSSSISFKTVVRTAVAFGVVMSLGTAAVAQTDPYDPSSPNYVGNKSKVKAPKINTYLSATAFRGLDKLAKPGAYYASTFGLKVGKTLRGALTVGYSHPFDLNADNPDRWEFEDVSLRLVNPTYWKSASKKQNLSLIGALQLPTSGTSRNSGLISRVSLTGRYTYRVRRFTFSLSPRVVGAYHRYETADESGFQKNSPLGASFGGAVRWGISRKWGLVGSASLYTLFDYDFDSRSIQSVSGSVQYSVNRKMSLSLSSSWRDRVITNNSLFDDAASSVSFTLAYSI